MSNPAAKFKEWVETEKHRQGQHNQKRHGWRFSGVEGARRAMRAGVSEDYQGKVTPESERDAYRKAAGMQEIEKLNKSTVYENPHWNKRFVTNSPLDYAILSLRERLMPPQFDELVSAINGDTSKGTQEYWMEKMRQTIDNLRDDGVMGNAQAQSANTRIDIISAGVNANRIMKNSRGEDSIWKPTGGDENFHDAQSEVAAYKLSELLGIKAVPFTEIKIVNGIEGSAQKIVSGSAGNPGKTISRRDKDGIIALDYIIQNPDRHAKNFVQSSDKVYAIDNGHAGWARVGKDVHPATVFERNPMMADIKSYSISPSLIKKWSKITRAQFDGAFLGIVQGLSLPITITGINKIGKPYTSTLISKSGNVNLNNAWENLQNLIRLDGKIKLED